MNDKPKKDLAASIRQRLTNKAQATGRPFQEVFEYFAIERFLYRLSQSRHADKFVLKGALMFTAWQAASARSTRDIDFLARMSNDQGEIAAVVREICTQELEPDGMRFDAESVQTGVIKEDAEYEGVRATFMAYLQNMRFAMQIDIGFVRKARLTQAPQDLSEVVQALGRFLLPIAEALSSGSSFKFTWQAPGPWE